VERKFEDKLIKIIDKNKFSPRLFSVILSNCVFFKTLILNNNKKIDITDITDSYSYVNACIQKYEDMIVSYRSQKKPTKLFIDELDKNRKLLIEYENKLLKVLEKELPLTKEIILTRNTHIIINNKILHNIEGPCIYNDDLSEIDNRLYFINDEYIDEEDWKRHPLVRRKKLNKLIKKIKKKNMSIPTLSFEIYQQSNLLLEDIIDNIETSKIKKKIEGYLIEIPKKQQLM